MSVTVVKRGDTMQTVARQVLLFNVPFDFSSPQFAIFTSGRDSNTPDQDLYLMRDVTIQAKANGDADAGVAGLPIFSGTTKVGVRTAGVAFPAGNTVALVKASPGPAGTVRQRVYMSHADDPAITPILYLAAEGPNGFMDSGGILLGEITGSYTKVSDAELLGPSPLFDESNTNGTGGLPVPAVPTVTAQAQSGYITEGTHTFAIVDVADPDTVSTRIILFEIVVRDLYNIKDFTFPQAGFEELQVVEDIQ